MEKSSDEMLADGRCGWMASVMIQRAGAEHDDGFDEGGEGFDLAVAVVVALVGGAVGDADGEEGDGGGDEVDAGVGGFGEHAEGAGEDSGEELEERDGEGGEDGGERGGAVSAWRAGLGCRAEGMVVMVLGGRLLLFVAGCWLRARHRGHPPPLSNCVKYSK